jgi:hypothetical protein
MKKRVLVKLHELATALQRYRTPDTLIDVVKTL